uniref:Tail protein n=1 Tax=viral metagenome TaxID=1070528 RepID=A0A6M3XMB1_9ZZZZ
MAVPINLFTRHTSVAFDDQTNYLTKSAEAVDANWRWLDCEVVLPDKVSLGREQEQYIRPNSAVGAVSPPIVGGRHGGELTIREVFKGQASSGWAAEDATAFSPIAELLADAIGGTVDLTFVDQNCVGNAVSATVDVTLATGYECGALVAWGVDGGTSVRGMGWIKDVTDDAQDTITLAAVPTGSGNNPTALDTTYASKTGYLSLDQPTAKTFRAPGHDEDWDFRAISCVPKSAKISLMPGMPPSVEIAYDVGDYEWDMTDDGTVRNPDSYQSFPAITDANGARFLIDGTEYTRGFGAGVEIEIVNTIDYFKGGGLEGYAAFVIPHREVTVKFQVPIQDSDLSANYLNWTNKFTAGTAFSFQFELGVIVGQVLSIYCPALKLSEQPQLVTVGNETVGLEITAKPSVPTGDATTHDGVAGCENTVFRFAVA